MGDLAFRFGPFPWRKHPWHFGIFTGMHGDAQGALNDETGNDFACLTQPSVIMARFLRCMMYCKCVNFCDSDHSISELVIDRSGQME